MPFTVDSKVPIFADALQQKMTLADYIAKFQIDTIWGYKPFPAGTVPKKFEYLKPEQSLYLHKIADNLGHVVKAINNQPSLKLLWNFRRNEKTMSPVGAILGV